MASDRYHVAAAVYGTITVAAVLAGWKASEPAQLLVPLVAYSLTFYFAHVYAAVIASGALSLRVGLPAAAAHEWPVFAAALPAIAVVALGAVLDFGIDLTVALALLACLVNLVLWQVAVLAAAQAGRGAKGRYWATVVLDAFVVAVIVVLRVAVK